MRRWARRRAWIGVVLAGGTAACSAEPDRGAVMVFAAASLTNALDEIARLHEERTGTKVTLSCAASSVLAKQIDAGAPADVFLSAHEDWTDWLSERGRLAGAPDRVLGNSLVLVAPRGRAFAFLVEGPAPLASAFEGRLALGDPDHVPAGVHAKEALVRAGWWADLEGRVVAASNVRSALALVERGECAAGVIYATDARASSAVDVVAEIPSSVTYSAAVVEGSRVGAGFLETLRSNEAVAVFRGLGFDVVLSVAEARS